MFKYVRVYSAVLDNATFGETSTEVCGIFTTANGQKNADGSEVPVGRTDAPTVNYGTSATAMNIPVSTEDNSVADLQMTAGKYYINAAGTAENLYVNGAKVTSGEAYEFNVESRKTTYLRIIAQNEMKEPFIKVIAIRGR